MKSARLTIAGMMLAIVAVAAGLAVMIRPLPIVATVVYSIAFLSLGVAVGGAIFSQRTGRAAWGGYLVFAGVFFVLCFAPWFRDEIEPNLLDSRALDSYYQDWMSYRPATPGESVIVYHWQRQAVPAHYDPDYYNRVYGPKYKRFEDQHPPDSVLISFEDSKGGYRYESPRSLRTCTLETFRQLGHSMGVIIFGWIGAVGAGIVAGRARRATPTPAIGVAPPIEPGL